MSHTHVGRLCKYVGIRSAVVVKLLVATIALVVLCLALQAFSTAATTLGQSPLVKRNRFMSQEYTSMPKPKLLADWDLYHESLPVRVAKVLKPLHCASRASFPQRSMHFLESCLPRRSQNFLVKYGSDETVSVAGPFCDSAEEVHANDTRSKAYYLYVACLNHYTRKMNNLARCLSADETKTTAQDAAIRQKSPLSTEQLANTSSNTGSSMG